MKQTLQYPTLAFQLGIRPGVKARDMSDVPLVEVCKPMVAFENKSNIYEVVPNSTPVKLKPENPKGHPEKDALMFYMLNHAVSLIRSRVHPLQPLGQYLPVMELFHEQLALRSARLYFYLLLICTRESRHEHKQGKLAGVYPKYPQSIKHFHFDLSHHEEAAVSALRKNPPDCTVGQYTTFLAEQFYKGGYGSSFGGKAWGNVADVMRDFTCGKLSAELMMDTGFTLCHNGGPIFNKGMLYSMYSNDIYKILDVQASGQIPQLIAEQAVSQAKDADVQAVWKFCRDILGEEFDGYVDWFKVEALASNKKTKGHINYHDLQQQQKAKHGPSPWAGKKSKAPPSLWGKVPVTDDTDTESDDENAYVKPVKQTPATVDATTTHVAVTPFDTIAKIARAAH